MDAQPSWVRVPRELEAGLLGAVRTRPAGERRAALGAAIGAMFPCAGRPPRWVQEPDWPVVDGTPAVFLGQHDLTSYRGDTTEVFVFVDAASGRVVLREQSA